MKVIKEIFSSKKFVTGIVSAIVAALAHFGFNVNEEALLVVLSPVMAAIAGQAYADGKGQKEKIKLEMQLKEKDNV